MNWAVNIAYAAKKLGDGKLRVVDHGDVVRIEKACAACGSHAIHVQKHFLDSMIKTKAIQHVADAVCQLVDSPCQGRADVN